MGTDEKGNNPDSGEIKNKMTDQTSPRVSARTAGSVNVAERGVAVGGNNTGNIITGNGNVIADSAEGIQTGGIRAGRIEAENIVDGMQIKGADAQSAEALVSLARQIRSGGISANEIKAKNLVSGLQFISNPDEPKADELLREISVLKEKLREAVAAGEIDDPRDAGDAKDSLEKAETEIKAPEPSGRRIVNGLSEASEILTRSAETLQAAGKVKAKVLELAPYAASLWQMATGIWGG